MLFGFEFRTHILPDSSRYKTKYFTDVYEEFFNLNTKRVSMEKVIIFFCDEIKIQSTTNSRNNRKKKIKGRVNKKKKFQDSRKLIFCTVLSYPLFFFFIIR